MLYAGLLGQWDEQLIAQTSDVPSMIFKLADRMRSMQTNGASKNLQYVYLRYVYLRYVYLRYVYLRYVYLRYVYRYVYLRYRYGSIWGGEGSKMAKNRRRRLWMAPNQRLNNPTRRQTRSFGYLKLK